MSVAATMFSKVANVQLFTTTSFIGLIKITSATFKDEEKLSCGRIYNLILIFLKLGLRNICFLNISLRQ